MSEVIFMNDKGVHSMSGKGDKTEIKPLFRTVEKTPQQKRDEVEAWLRLKPVWFSKWMWEKACQHEPQKYKMYLPVYQGSEGQIQRVVLT